MYAMKNSAAAALTARLWSKSKLSHYSIKKEVLTTYFHMLIHLWESLATDDIFAETDSKTARFVRPLLTLSPLEFAKELWLKTLKWSRVHDEYVLKVIFVEGLLQYTRHSRRGYWGTHKTAAWQNLAYHATSLTNLQAASHAREQPAVHSNNRHKLNNFRTNRRPKTICNIILSSNKLPWLSYTGTGVEGLLGTTQALCH